ncbi:STAS domain-containing protein [Kitasatospora sp. NPDC049285]|uniref:STAS domain-containing protein n=1 Tax=Kitasatospora sp. NPDC049285 TaxID=3157096 RepID=UPI00343ACD33
MDALHTIPSSNGPSPASPPLVTVSQAPGGTVVVHLTGELDQDRQPVLDHALARAVRSRPLRLVIDMTGVVFCDCVGLNALLKTRHAAQQAGVDLQLSGLRHQATRLLEITQADALFTIADNALPATRRIAPALDARPDARAFGRTLRARPDA